MAKPDESAQENFTKLDAMVEVSLYFITMCDHALSNNKQSYYFQGVKKMFTMFMIDSNFHQGCWSWYMHMELNFFDFIILHVGFNTFCLLAIIVHLIHNTPLF